MDKAGDSTFKNNDEFLRKLDPLENPALLDWRRMYSLKR